MNKYRSEGMRREIIERDKRREFDVLVSDFLMPSINVPVQLSAPTVLFDRNVEANVVKRYCRIQRNPLKRAYLHSMWRKTMAFEQETCRRFDQVITVSAADRETIRSDYGVESVQDIPTGVDAEYFRPSGNEKPSRNNLVFTGMMNWLPNEDAVCYFVQEILPLVRQVIPDVTLTVVGRDPYPRLLELSSRDPAITVTGRVDDVRPYLERATCFIVPLRVGSGVRLKIFEAMAMEKPVVSTAIGAEGLPVRNGIDVLLADTPAEFAASVVRLLNHEEYARAFGAQAAARVRAEFTWARAAEAFAEICQNTIDRKAETAPPVPTPLLRDTQTNVSNHF
jgi:glycosyltransferase involved in cell wall biosynthesis